MADKKYETGIETRKLILAECRKLFLDKGFHETSYNDICKAAHVNRGSIYYHFKQKDMIRYEILWEIYTDNKRFAEQYTSVSSHQYVFALYLAADPDGSEAWTLSDGLLHGLSRLCAPERSSCFYYNALPKQL